MSRKGLERRQRGSILVQLGASAGVLVLPPLMMSAGVALFGAQTEDRLQISSDQTIVSAVSKSSALIPLSARQREVPKSADRPPLHDDPAASASQPATIPAVTAVSAAAVTATTVEPAIEADESSTNANTEATAEPVPFLGPISVTLVVVRKEPEPEPAEPEEEPTPEPSPPAPPVASIEPVVPHATPKAPPAHVAHPHIKPDREEARAPHRIAEKRPHAPPATPHGPAPHPSAASAHRAAAGASVAAKAKPRLQHRADLEN
jgi:outer membrane biosynthesis protein TonB